MHSFYKMFEHHANVLATSTEVEYIDDCCDCSISFCVGLLYQLLNYIIAYSITWVCDTIHWDFIGKTTKRCLIIKLECLKIYMVQK